MKEFRDAKVQNEDPHNTSAMAPKHPRLQAVRDVDLKMTTNSRPQWVCASTSPLTGLTLLLASLILNESPGIVISPLVDIWGWLQQGERTCVWLTKKGDRHEAGEKARDTSSASSARAAQAAHEQRKQRRSSASSVRAAQAVHEQRK